MSDILHFEKYRMFQENMGNFLKKKQTNEQNYYNVIDIIS